MRHVVLAALMIVGSLLAVQATVATLQQAASLHAEEHAYASLSSEPGAQRTELHLPVRSEVTTAAVAR